MKKELQIKVRQWLTRASDFNKNPMPMRTMFGYIDKESPKAYYLVVHGKPAPTSHCLHCGKVLTHPVSLLYGIGPVCGKHFHINPLQSEEELEAAMEELKKKLADVKWEGWVPKSSVEEMIETGETIGEEKKTEPEPEKLEKKPAPKKVDDPRYKLEITEDLINDLYRELQSALG